jgi:apolipoprotein N-acyltransferase
VRASTSGPSAMIDPAGRIVDVLPFDSHGVVRADVAPRRDLTVYARIGEAFAWTCVVLTLLLASRKILQLRQTEPMVGSPS